MTKALFFPADTFVIMIKLRSFSCCWQPEYGIIAKKMASMPFFYLGERASPNLPCFDTANLYIDKTNFLTGKILISCIQKANND